MSKAARRFRRRSRLGRVPVVLYLALAAANGVASRTPVPGTEPEDSHSVRGLFRRLVDMPEIRVSPEQHYSLGGVPLSIWTFETSSSLNDTLRILSAQTDYFQHVLVQGNVLVLSGLNGRRHWLAELSPGDNRIAGRISGLSLDEPLPRPNRGFSSNPDGKESSSRQSASSSSYDAAIQWHPPWSSLVFSSEAIQEGEPSLTVLRLSGPAKAARNSVSTHLLENAWTAVGEPGVSETWLKKSVRLRLFFDCAGASCYLLGYLWPST